MMTMAALRSPLGLFLRWIAWNLLVHESWSWIVSHDLMRKGRVQDFRASLSLLSSSPITDADDYDGADALSRALAKSHPVQSSWYANTGLPFECTECGKCCKTRGSVYMNPTEIQQACDLLNMSRQDFIDTYASRILFDEKENESTAWVRLKNNNEGACVFLNDENQCEIYQARPAQCSTYPFWPRIMQSNQTWNEEVRIPDHVVLEENEELIPYWTAHEGGCEGMKMIGDTNDLGTVVSAYEAYNQLLEYERAEQSFPKEAITLRVKRKQARD